MATPQLPQRKGPNVNVSPNGTKMGASFPLPVRKAATPFGTVTRESVLPTSTAPVSPTSVPTNDKDAGNGTGNVR